MAPSTSWVWLSASAKKVFQASTSEVYGDPAVHHHPETYYGSVNLIGMRSCCDEGKRYAETLFSTTTVQIKAARIFNAYGPRTRPNDCHLVSNVVV